ncbi:hypothetical protein [Variovorax paradoxus]
MQKLSTSGGRLFTVTVQGPRVTLADTMVAAPHYLRVLEEQFDSAADVLRCLRAWENGGPLRPGNVPDEQNSLIRRWVNAHHMADVAARRWLSQPDAQNFEVTLASNMR